MPQYWFQCGTCHKWITGEPNGRYNHYWNGYCSECDAEWILPRGKTIPRMLDGRDLDNSEKGTTWR